MFRSELAYNNWKTKYRYGNEEPLDTFKRVAKALASVEKEPEHWEEKFLNTMVKFDLNGEAEGLKCTTGGRITANIGTSYQHATLMNCFSGDTEYLDINRGIVRLNDMCGKETTILTKKGIEKATIECFGIQKTFDFIFKPAYSRIEKVDAKGRHTTNPEEVVIQREVYRPNPKSSYSIKITATKDHRWILCNGRETTDLKIGDVVETNTYEVSECNEEYNKGFIHGLIFGDGSLSYTYTNKPNSSGKFGLKRYYVRLCGKKSQYISFFKAEDVTYSPSHDGDPTGFYTSDKDLKNLPNYENIDYIRGFIKGWLATDGCYTHGDTKDINEISTTNTEASEWLEKYAFIAGYIVTGYRYDPNTETNYGKRNKGIVRITLSQEKVKMKVTGILENEEQEVFCAVVPNEKSFTLSCGIYTGNCFVHGPISKASIKYHRQSEDDNVGYDVEYTTDETPDDLTNIFLTILEQAKTLATEGGYGINFSFIRPRGSIIKGIGIKHPGVLAYMDVFDEVSNCIVRGTNDGYVDKLKNYLKEENIEDTKMVIKAMARKGAMMAVLDCSHPDIEEFIRAKQEAERLTKFNMSVLISDEFMMAVERDEFFDLRFNGKVFKTLKARDLYGLIMESTYKRNEPGVLFEGNMNRNNPISYLGKLTCTNPCGEIGGLASLTTVCLLGSINLTQYVLVDSLGNRSFDWDTYIEDIRTFTRMLDNVNDLSYISLPSYQWATDNLRQFGMGVNGLGSALMMLGIPYNSNEALTFTKKICQIKENITWQTSALLAKEKGTFKGYNKEKFESTEYFKSERITEETRNLLRKYGARNAKTTTNPPLGNTSVITGTSNGIEPVFNLEYERVVICKEWPEGLNSDNVRNYLKKHKGKDHEYWRGIYDGKVYHYEPSNRGLCEVTIVRDFGYQWLLDNFPDIDHKPYLTTTEDLNIEDHLRIQEVVQYYNNQSVSKTCNLPNEYPFEEFKDLYYQAWKRGLNGFTTYRAGTMESVISNISKTDDTKNIITKDIKLPKKFINGPTSVEKRQGYKFYIHFSYLPDDTNMAFPVVMWIYTNARYKGEDLKICNKAARNLGKLALESGIDQKIVIDTLEKAKADYPHNRLGRMVSLNLRHNVPRGDILSALLGIDGDNISTLLFAVRKYLSETLPNGTRLNGVRCDNPDCTGSRTNVVLESGCKRCLDCGASSCGI